MTNIRSYHGWHLPGAAAAQSSRDGDVLLAAGREGHRETLHRGRQPCPPQLRTGLYVNRMEDAIQVAHESHAAARGKNRCEKRSPLRHLPHFFHGVHVVRGELADVAIRPGHLKEPAIGRSAARAFLIIGLAPEHFHAGLAERNDELRRPRVIAHRLPVVPAFGGWTRRDPRLRTLLDDIVAVVNLAGFLIDAVEDVLIDRLLIVEKLAGLAV